MEIYLSLCEAVRDISGVQRHLSTLRSLCVFLLRFSTPPCGTESPRFSDES